MNWTLWLASGALGLLVGAIVLAAGMWLDARRARKAEAMERMATASEQAAEGFNRLADSARRIRFPRGIRYPEDDRG